MSTRAIIIFRDKFSEFHIYKHGDGTRRFIEDILQKAKEFTWPEYRWEAGDAAAAFIRFAKNESGHIYLSDPKGLNNSDVDNIFLVTCDGKTVKLEKVE